MVVHLPVFDAEDIAAENRSYLHWVNDEGSSGEEEKTNSSGEEEGARSSSEGSKSEYHPSGTSSQPSDEVLSAVLSADEVENLAQEAANLSIEEAAIPAMDDLEVPMEVDRSMEEASRGTPAEAAVMSAEVAAAPVVPPAVPSKRVEVTITKKPPVPRVGTMRVPRVRSPSSSSSFLPFSSPSSAFVRCLREEGRGLQRPDGWVRLYPLPAVEGQMLLERLQARAPR